MGYPCPVVPCIHFPELVLTYFLQRFLIGRRIALDRNLCSHPSHGVNATAMARLDQEVNIRLQKMFLHRYRRPIRKHKVRTAPELLDEAEDVIPAPTVQT